MFTVEERERLKSEMISAAKADDRIGAAALFGSSAIGGEDPWSDIDLGLCVQTGRYWDAAVADWTTQMYQQHGALHHFDVIAAAAVYRVFLLASTLQVDLSFWPPGELRATGLRFRMLFGNTATRHVPSSSHARERHGSDVSQADELVGWGWLYALHARSSIGRGRAWQAEHMISGLRDRVLALACLRHGLPTREGRGIDDLPAAITQRLLPTLVDSLDPLPLKCSLLAAIDALIAEADHADPQLAQRLADPLREIGTGRD
jgi:hypothetical protein